MNAIGNVSGIALKLMFMDAKLKTLKHQETFGEGVQRRVNLIKKGMALINTAVESAQSLQITPQFEFYLPSNEQELINMLVTSTGGKAIISQKTAVGINPFVTNAATEMEVLNDEAAGQFGNIFPEPLQ
jgi:SPP1 family phage portal protein